MSVTNTVADVSRAVARLDEFASIGERDAVNIHGLSWTGFDMRVAAAQNIALQISRNLSPYVRGKVSKRDVSVILASHGASAFTIEQHANAIARLIRSDFSNGRQS